jgi:hypothetical protein
LPQGARLHAERALGDFRKAWRRFAGDATATSLSGSVCEILAAKPHSAVRRAPELNSANRNNAGRR